MLLCFLPGPSLTPTGLLLRARQLWDRPNQRSTRSTEARGKPGIFLEEAGTILIVISTSALRLLRIAALSGTK